MKNNKLDMKINKLDIIFSRYPIHKFNIIKGYKPQIAESLINNKVNVKKIRTRKLQA